MPRLKIAIVTTGRFHVLDLARELSALGHEVAFHSLLPKRRALRFGLPAECYRGGLRWLWPLVGLQRFGPRRLQRWASRALVVGVDLFMSRRLQSCDVFIGMSGVCVESARAAREQHGARVFIERGSQHITTQRAILDALVKRGVVADTVSDLDEARELASYAVADVVVIPSLHTEQSFLDKGFDATRLFRNPYGVDLDVFPLTEAPRNQEPIVLFVGGWTFRKGVDVLAAVSRRRRSFRMLHVGSLGDAPATSENEVTHVGHVQQWRLTEYYALADVVVLPSREEGLALVLIQALASGVPVVCSPRSGGVDLQEMMGDRQWIHVVPADDEESLAKAIQQMLEHSRKLRGVRDLFGPARERLSWRAYGLRYSDKLVHGI